MVVKANITNLPDMKVEERFQAEKDNAGGQRLDPWYKTEDSDVASYNGLKEKLKSTEAIRQYGATKVAAWDKAQTKLLKEIACVVVLLRKQFVSNKGNFPDWNGATRAYQDEVGRMYMESGVPARHVNGLRNALYYHINNLVVEVAPKKELEALGMLTVSRKARQTKKAATPTPPVTNDTDGTTPVIAGVEVPPEEPKGNQAEYLLMVGKEMMERVLESKDLMKADKGKVADLLEAIQATTLQIGDALSEATEKANKRRAQSAARRAAAAEASNNAA